MLNDRLPLQHGGKLREAANRYNIPLVDWVDLSTGINPNGWLPKSISPASWNRLPEVEDGLLKASQQYYNCTSLLPVAGSQAAIQILPTLFESKKNIGILNLSYAEHAFAWKKAGHNVIPLTQNSIEGKINELDILLIVNPNNPTGKTIPADTLISWHNTLKNKNGWLIVDEAFMDCTPERSILPESHSNNLIVLRSIGKFFGLAGIRVGFVNAQQNILDKLNQALGPWTISAPARECATLALEDHQWQTDNQVYLETASNRLVEILSANKLSPTGSTKLFSWIKTPHAKQLHEDLANQGILTRLFSEPDSLRFGLPANEKQWQQLSNALRGSL